MRRSRAPRGWSRAVSATTWIDALAPATRERRPRSQGACSAQARLRGTSEPPSTRVQKLLSAAGIGSRREVERWIREGRLQVNGEVPALGAKLAARDRITLDGRPVRLHAPKSGELHVLLFHRSPGETLDLKAATSRAAEHLQPAALLGPLARDPAHAAGGRRA